MQILMEENHGILKINDFAIVIFFYFSLRWEKKQTQFRNVYGKKNSDLEC